MTTPLPIIPGCYLVRLVRNGPEVPARILFDGFFYIVVTNGMPDRQQWTADDTETMWGDAAIEGEAFAHPLLRIVLFGRPITEAEYGFRERLRGWARQHDPEHPAANATKPIDLTKSRPIF